MTAATFKAARDFLLANRTDYATAYRDFRWPALDQFNWALDWFDAELAHNPDSKDRPALWIVDAGSSRYRRQTPRSRSLTIAVGIPKHAPPRTVMVTNCPISCSSGGTEE